MKSKVLSPLALSLLVVSALSITLHAATPPPENLQLFLLIGQSNMAGRGAVETQDNTPHPRVFMLTKDLQWVPAVEPMHFDKPVMVGAGPGSAFGRAIADSDPSRNVGLIPAAFGGTSLDQWQPGGELYQNALTRAREAMKHGKLAGILWHQGESDIAGGKVGTYAERFSKMITQLRADLGAPELPVIVGEIGPFVAGREPINDVLKKLPVQVPHCAFVSSEGLTDKGDKLHFDAASQRELGRRYARAFLAPTAAQTDINWPVFLKRHDLVWEDLPWQWNEGAFLGNGQFGVVAYATLDDNRFDFHLGRADVTDHRKAPDRKTSRGAPGTEVMDVMYDFPRLDIGRLALRPAGKITGGNLRVDLWNAELTGTITTDRGELKLRSVILRDRMAQRIDVLSTERDATGKPLAYTWEFRPGNPSSPRALVFPDRPQSKSYVTNPPPVLTKRDDVPVCVQSLLAGGDYATAWLEQRASASEGTIYVSTANEVPAANRSADLAVRTVREAQSQADADLAAHRAWWHAYYPKSFLTIPDARLESFYWIQLFKFAAASRPDGPPIDVLGPFYRTTQWPGLWWNLNVQLTYWLAYAGNHLDLGQNLISELDANFDGLWTNYADNQKIGDFAWVLHNYWLHYRYAGDWAALRTGWMPKAKVVAADYIKRLKPDASGRLELPATESPEYDGFKTYHNSNYNLALLRWLLNSMLELDARSGLAPDPAATEWRRVLATLVPYPTDKNGLMIGSDQPMAMSHRHYSHLLGLYPLFQLNPDSPADRDLVVKSVRHWHQIDSGKELAGYSYTGAAALYAALGLGDNALTALNHFLTVKIGPRALLLPNTLYVESGGKNPVIETPLSVASATQELLLQSWGGKLRVFPAVPAAWRDAAFADLRGQGGFLVSAVREAGSTAWVTIHSEAGEPCVIKVPDWTAAVPEVTGPATAKLTVVAPGEFRIDLRKGETALLRAAGSHATPVVRALPTTSATPNPYGLKLGGHLTSPQLWPEPTVTPIHTE